MLELARRYGFIEEQREDFIPWREAFDGDESTLPADMLFACRDNLGWSQRHLSEITGIPQRHISEMENGKRPIGKETARKLAEAFGISYRAFL
jgi:plasmid maintenance system antidote protein VapI